MNLTPMRFKTFTWPHNPETFSITWERTVPAHKVPYGRYCLQDLGISRRVLRGEGEFAGADAYEQFRSLANVFYQSGPGLLVHPIFQTSKAYFVTLELVEKPLPDYVRYTFTFLEDGVDGTGLKQVREESSATGSAATGSGGVYLVKKGDTLWGIARRHNVTLQSLIACNPQIKNPNLIYPGEQVKLP